MSVADKLLELIKKVGPIGAIPFDPRKRNPNDDPSRWYTFWKPWPGSRNKYLPHQGERECARRVRQRERDA